jgi:hypothetical protein
MGDHALIQLVDLMSAQIREHDLLDRRQDPYLQAFRDPEIGSSGLADRVRQWVAFSGSAS